MSAQPPSTAHPLETSALVLAPIATTEPISTDAAVVPAGNSTPPEPMVCPGYPYLVADEHAIGRKLGPC
jgi:hypothetical protein